MPSLSPMLLSGIKHRASRNRFACPACSTRHEDSYEAADCCLWTSISPADRFRIAGAVARGSAWPEAIAEVTGDTRLLS